MFRKRRPRWDLVDLTASRKRQVGSGVHSNVSTSASNNQAHSSRWSGPPEGMVPSSSLDDPGVQFGRWPAAHAAPSGMVPVVSQDVPLTRVGRWSATPAGESAGPSQDDPDEYFAAQGAPSGMVPAVSQDEPLTHIDRWSATAAGSSAGPSTPSHAHERAYPGLRDDGPGRLAYRRGSLPSSDTPYARAAAKSNLSSQRLSTVVKMLKMSGMQLFPLSAEKVLALGATLTAGGYRSGNLYLSAARIDCVRHGQQIDSATSQAIADAVRSCERGMGPARKVSGLPMSRLAGLPDDDGPWAAQGPLAPKRVIIAGAWWLTREIEISNARAALVCFSGSGSSLTASWCLPASKTDAQAFGTERTHGCWCGVGVLGDLCPAHVLLQQRQALLQWFPSLHDKSGIPGDDLPLFPDAKGNPCSKEALVDTIRAAAKHLHLPQRSPDGLVLWAGHTPSYGCTGFGLRECRDMVDSAFGPLG